MPHWHEHNPWKDKVVYVPLERLAECAAGGKVSYKGNIVDRTPEFLVSHWHRAVGKDKLDAYILPSPNGLHSIGIRYGAEGWEYYSPHNNNPAVTDALLKEYQNAPATE